MNLEKRPDDAVIEMTEGPGSRDSQHHLKATPHTPIAPSSTWPQEPVPLVPDKSSSLWAALYDAVLLAVPIILIAKIGLVIAAWHIDRNHRGGDIDLVSPLTTFLIEFNGQLVTAFTIVFVTIVSTLVRRYALWKAQKGAYVSELEQLQGSISLPSTLKLIWSLRAFTTTSIALVGVWCFYYLGSQATQREYRQVISGSSHKLEGYTAASNLPSGFSPDFDETAVLTAGNFKVSVIDDALIAAEAFANSPFQTGPQGTPGTDMTGSALVPDLNSILNIGWAAGSGYVPPEKGRHGWVDVAKQSKTFGADYYTSFIGRPLYFTLADDASGVSAVQLQRVVGNYKYKTRYLDVSCSDPALLPYRDFVNGTHFNQSISFNMTQTRSDAPRDRYNHALREFDLYLRWIPNNDYGIIEAGSSKQTCAITWVNVELKIHCQDSGCFPHKMRYLDNASQADATSYRTPFDDDTFSARFFSSILLARGPQLNISQETLIGTAMLRGLQNWIGAPPGYTGSDGTNWQNFLAAEPGGINKTLSKYFNSYYMMSQDATGVSPDYTASDPNYYTIKMKGSYYDPHYAIFWEWIAIDIVSCLILLVAAVVALWLRTQTLAPDIFGYVSSLTRDNPNLELPNSGTTLNGIERARMLKKVKVKIGDVSDPDVETGRVGLAQVGAGSSRPVENLKPTTAYV